MASCRSGVQEFQDPVIPKQYMSHIWRHGCVYHSRGNPLRKIRNQDQAFLFSLWNPPHFSPGKRRQVLLADAEDFGASLALKTRLRAGSCGNGRDGMRDWGRGGDGACLQGLLAMQNACKRKGDLPVLKTRQRIDCFQGFSQELNGLILGAGMVRSEQCEDRLRTGLESHLQCVLHQSVPSASLHSHISEIDG